MSEVESDSRRDAAVPPDLVAFLRERAEANGGEFYFKSRFIADEVGLSPSQLAVYLSRLRTAASGVGLELEKWSYTGATTWRVTLP